MPEETSTSTTEPPAKGGDEGKTFTQADVDRVVEQRLARERAKYSDYDDLKAKAEKYDEAEAANKTEADKLRDEVAQLKKAQSDNETKALRAEIAMSKGLSAAQAKRLVGTTKEELEADADEILEAFPTQNGGNPPPSNKPTPDLKGGGDPTEEPTETDPGKLAEGVPRF